MSVEELAGILGGTGWIGHERCKLEVSRGLMVAVELSVSDKVHS